MRILETMTGHCFQYKEHPDKEFIIYRPDKRAEERL